MSPSSYDDKVQTIWMLVDHHRQPESLMTPSFLLFHSKVMALSKADVYDYLFQLNQFNPAGNWSVYRMDVPEELIATGDTALEAVEEADITGKPFYKSLAHPKEIGIQSYGRWMKFVEMESEVRTEKCQIHFVGNLSLKFELNNWWTTDDEVKSCR